MKAAKKAKKEKKAAEEAAIKAMYGEMTNVPRVSATLCAEIHADKPLTMECCSSSSAEQEDWEAYD